MFILVGLLPVLLLIFIGLRFTQTLADDALGVRQQFGQTYLTRDVQARTRTMVQQVQQYAINHTEISMEDRFMLPSNADLALLTATRIGERGYSFVYDLNSVVIFHPDPDMVRQLLFQRATLQPDLWKIITDSFSTTSLVDGYYNELSAGQTRTMYLAAQQVPNTQLWVGVAVDTDEFLASNAAIEREAQNHVNEIRLAYFVLLPLLGGAVAFYAFFAAARLAAPVEWMAQTTTQLMRYLETISRGLKVQTFQDEIKYLGYAIGLLSKQLRAQVSNLEELVRDRTTELARRTAQVETAAQVARESAQILDVEELLKQTTIIISERFGFYHAGIFLIDQAGEYALLRASNSEGGRRMLARQHKLRIGQGVVGFVSARGEPRIVLDTGAEAIHFKNPDLPFTRSELALPMRVRGRTIGVLDVQSTDPNAYTEEDTRILQVLADQLALAIENARLYNESQRALAELETAYGEQAREGWQQRLKGHTLVYAYNRAGVQVSQVSDDLGVQTIPLEPKSALVDGQYELSLPLMLRNRPLGTVTLRREADQSPWSPEEIDVVRESATQVASILENARLLEEIARRARQESLLGQVSTRVQASLDLDAVLSAAVREVGLALSASRVEIDLSTTSQGTQN
jgi:GAF domain-containing protein